MGYRVGQEPALDLKRLLVSACKEAGLGVRDACAMLNWNKRRLVSVDAIQKDWPHLGCLQVLVEAEVEPDGGWPNGISILAIAPIPGEQFTLLSIPLLQREVPVGELIPALHETLAQQAEVIAARVRGERGPWVFGDVEWKWLGAD